MPTLSAPLGTWDSKEWQGNQAHIRRIPPLPGPKIVMAPKIVPMERCRVLVQRRGNQKLAQDANHADRGGMRVSRKEK